MPHFMQCTYFYGRLLNGNAFTVVEFLKNMVLVLKNKQRETVFIICDSISMEIQLHNNLFKKFENYKK